MQHLRTARRLLGAACLALAAAACGDDAPAGSGTVAVQLTDAPFPFDSVARVDIFVVRVEAKRADASDDDAERVEGEGRRDGDPSREWVTLAAPNASIDLLGLQNGRVTSLGENTLPVGAYRGFRLIIDPARSSVTLKNGTQPNVVWPSAARSGIKVKLDRPFEVASDRSVMVLDFDLGRSFVLRGRSISQNGLLFKPVIRATAREGTGSIAGSVRAGGATGALVTGASVEVLRAGTAESDTAAANVVATTATEAGAFKAAWLLPGSYALRVTAPSSLGSTRAYVPSVTVQSGQETVQAVVLP